MNTSYLTSPTHRLTIHVVGVGATGTYLLYHLARMNVALTSLGHPGLIVTAYDFDLVSRNNIGKQMFFEEEIGMHKSTAIINRINNAFGFQWNDKIQDDIDTTYCNVLFTCTDKVSSRLEIQKSIQKSFNTNRTNEKKTLLAWIDCGNDKDFGQVICTLLTKRKKGKPIYAFNGNTFFDYYPKAKDNKQAVSCSLAESLGKQDFNTNPFAAIIASKYLWELIQTSKLKNSATFFNLSTMSMSSENTIDYSL